jgi:hypothetical protein
MKPLPGRNGIGARRPESKLTNPRQTPTKFERLVSTATNIRGQSWCPCGMINRIQVAAGSAEFGSNLIAAVASRIMPLGAGIRPHGHPRGILSARDII